MISKRKTLVLGAHRHHHHAAGRFPLRTTQEWGEGKGEGIPIAVSIRWRAPLRMNPEEHPTSNIQRRTSNGSTSAFGVRCWTFDVFPRFRGSMHEISWGNLSLAFSPLWPRTQRELPWSWWYLSILRRVRTA